MQSSYITNILLVCVIALVAFGIFTNRTMTVDMTQSDTDRTITVDGTSEVFVKPDTAKVSFGVTYKNTSTDIATQSVNQRMATLMNSLEAVGVAENDIKTTSYTISPEYVYNDGQRNFDGYRVTQRTEVIMRDLDIVSDVLGIVNTADLDNVSQLTFYVDDEDAIKQQLQEEAIADARENAKRIAKDLGVDLKQVVGFYDGSVEGDSVKYDYARSLSMESVDAEAPVSISEGENQFTASVSVTYKIQ